MPLSIISAMMFGGAFVGSYLSDKAGRAAYQEAISKSMILKADYLCKQIDYIRPQTWALWKEFSQNITNDTLIPDMILVGNAFNTGYLSPSTDNRFYRLYEADYNGYRENDSYYNWWEEYFYKTKVQIYPDISSEAKAEKMCKDICIKSITKLQNDNVYVLSTNAEYMGWGGSDMYKNRKEERLAVKQLKEDLNYNPPPMGRNKIETEYFDYHYSHPIKTKAYLEQCILPRHKKQSKEIRRKILLPKLLTYKQWEDRLIFEYKGQVPGEFMMIDYFLRWCYRNKIDITDQERRAFFNGLVPNDTCINYGDIFVTEYNTKDKNDKLKMLFADGEYGNALAMARTGKELGTDYVWAPSAIREKNEEVYFQIPFSLEYQQKLKQKEEEKRLIQEKLKQRQEEAEKQNQIREKAAKKQEKEAKKQKRKDFWRKIFWV